MMWRMRRAALGIVAVIAVVFATSVAATRPGAAAPATTACGPDPFTGLDAILAGSYPGQRFTAAVYDERTGCEFTFHPELRLGTASVFKVEIMAGVLYDAAVQGRGLTAYEDSLIAPMIEESANEPASELYQYLGGQAAFADFNNVFGLSDTDAAPPLWGNTQTTAADQVTLLRNVLPGTYGPLPDGYRQLARGYMTSVVPEQRWGVTAGVTPGWVVAQKNGFAPAACCGWRINSVGRVEDPRGGGYDIAILTDGWPDEGSGIVGNELVAQFVSAFEARVPVGPFATGDAFVVQQYRDLFGRDPDPYGLVFWTNAVDAAGAAAVFESLFASPEEQVRNEVAYLYLSALDRLPDIDGFDFWSGAVASGQLSITDVAEGFARSPEFGAPAGNAAFVSYLYQHVLHRAPDDAGAAYWLSLLQNGTLTRGQELLLFSESPELRDAARPQVEVLVIYRAMLRRFPDDAGLAFWADQLRANAVSPGQLAALVMSSAEYAARVTP